MTVSTINCCPSALFRHIFGPLGPLRPATWVLIQGLCPNRELAKKSHTVPEVPCNCVAGVSDPPAPAAGRRARLPDRPARGGAPVRQAAGGLPRAGAAAECSAQTTGTHYTRCHHRLQLQSHLMLKAEHIMDLL